MVFLIFRILSGRDCQGEKPPWEGAWCFSFGLGGLFTQAEGFDEFLVAGGIDFFEVVEEAAAVGDEFHQAAAAVHILLVGFEVLGEVGDTLGQDGDLDFGRAGVFFGAGVGFDQFGLAFGGDGHGGCFLSRPLVITRFRPGVRPARGAGGW